MKWNIGSEYDETLFNKPGEALVKLGFNLSTNWTGVGGSQEIFRWGAESNEGKLIIQAETYVGLTIEGHEEIVNKVKMNSDTGKIANNRFVRDRLTALLCYAGGPTSKR